MADQSKRNMAGPLVGLWGSARERFSLQLLRLGKDKRWHFLGQQPGEDVRLVVRKHWWFLVQPGLPLLGAVGILFVVLWLALLMPPAMAALWGLVVVLAVLGVIAAAIWFIYRDLVAWWFETYIITNKRIVSWKGLVEPVRKAILLSSVQQVGTSQKDILGVLLGYGTVNVYLDGSQLNMEGVPHPKKVREALQGIVGKVTPAKAKEEKQPMPQDRDIAGVLEQLAKGKEVPPLPDPDADYPPLRGHNGPRRTFGGILRIPCDVRYTQGERTVKYIQRSKYVLARDLFSPLMSLFVLLLLSVVSSFSLHLQGTALQIWWSVVGLAAVALLIWAGLIYTNYVDDVYILTTKRIIDINRHLIFFYPTRDETEYKNIINVRVRIPSPIQRFLDVGDVVIETPGSNPDIILRTVDHPFQLQDEVMGIKTYKERADDARKDAEAKKNLQRWFAAVLVKLEEKAKSRGAPDLSNMEVLTAMAYAREVGLDVSVSGEAEESANIPPGQVVRQNPLPGTLMEEGSKIEVVLSKRPTQIKV
ncbi:MAG: PH domain-containing protein [Ktedonobacteraceae bacterium]|nr:PH domain-containing protein [Ktedonobacteraceae bacterium]